MPSTLDQCYKRSDACIDMYPELNYEKAIVPDDRYFFEEKCFFLHLKQHCTSMSEC